MRVKQWLKLVKIWNNYRKKKRCGWFDAVAVKHAGRLNGCDQLALMKLDVLDGFKTIKICVGMN